MKKVKSIITFLLIIVLVFTGSIGEVQDEIYAKQIEKSSDNKNMKILYHDTKIKGNNSVGVMVADSITSKQEEQSQNNGCNIFYATVENNCVNVCFETIFDGTLVVGIYDEDGIKMLASGTEKVSAGDKQAKVFVETDCMPEYFYLRVFLVDSSTLKPLTNSYESPNYTEEMQQFLEKTTDDFDQDRLLNMDEDKTTNFAVYSESTIIIPHNNKKNQLISSNEETREYVFENSDANMTSLQKGDIFSYSMENGCELIVKVAEIEKNGTTVTITGKDSSLEEVFEYVKIDTQASTGDVTIDTSTCDKGVICNGLVEDETNKSTKERKNQSVSVVDNKVTAEATQVDAMDIEKSEGHVLSYEFLNVKILGDNDKDNVKVSGKAELQKEASVKVYISLSYQYLELKMDYGLKADISVSGEGKGEISLGTLGFSSVPGVIIEVAPQLNLEVSAKVSLEGSLIGTIGFAVSGDEGIKNLTSRPELKSSLKTEGTVFIGLSIEPRVVVIDEKVAKVGLKAKVGGEFKGEMILKHSDAFSKIHTCKKCIDGDVFAKLTLECEAKLLNSDKLKYRLELTNISIKIADFYYSFDKNESGWSECPYIKYKINIKVKDKNENALNEVLIKAPFSILGDNGEICEKEEIKTNTKGETVGYLANGEYILQIVKDGYQLVEKKITVKDENKSVVVNLGKKMEDDVVDVSLYLDELDNFVKKLKEKVKQEDVVMDNPTTFQTDTIDIQWTDYSFSVTNNGCKYVSICGIEIGNKKSLALKKIKQQGICYIDENEEDKSRVTCAILNNDKVVFILLGFNKDEEVIEWNVCDYGATDYYDVFFVGKLLKAQEKYGVEELCDWQKAYFDYILQTYVDSSIEKYSLIYVDDDAIPEMVKIGNSLSRGDHVCTWKTDELVILDVYSNGISYIKYHNLICDSGGHMDAVRGGRDAFYDKIYCIEDGKFKLMHSGNYGTKDNANIEYDENGSPIYQYYWDNIEVTENEYKNKKNKCFDSTIAKDPYQEEMLECEEVIEEIVKAGITSQSIKKFSLSTPKTASVTANFSNLQPNQSYTFFAVKSRNTTDLLSSKNLLYINQAVSDNRGKIQFIYKLKEKYNEPELFLGGEGKDDVTHSENGNEETESNTEDSLICTITFEPNGGTNLMRYKKYILKSKSIGLLPTVQRNNYTFLGWYTKKEGGTKVNKDRKIVENLTLYAHWKKTVKPEKCKILRLKSEKSSQLIVIYSKVNGSKGYEIVYSTSKNFKKSETKKVVTTALQKTLTKLNKKKVYYVKIRAFTIDSVGKKVYGSYSVVKKMRTK